MKLKDVHNHVYEPQEVIRQLIKNKHKFVFWILASLSIEIKQN